MKSMQIKNNSIFSGNPTPTKIHLIDRNDTISSAYKVEKNWKDKDYSYRESLDVSKDLDDLHIQIGKLFSKNTTSGRLSLIVSLNWLGIIPVTLCLFIIRRLQPLWT
jgi:hypothetical protein